MEQTICHENYPAWIVIISNLVSMGIYVLGFLIIYRLGLVFSILYLLYILLLELRLIGSHCTRCFYWGKICGFGKGKISSWFFRKGDISKFCDNEFTWIDMIPDLLITLIPLIIGIIILILGAILVSKFFLMIVNVIHKPREGVFARDKSDKDFCYWSLRAIIRKWPVWLARQLNLPLFETLILKILGVKTSFSNSLNEGWVDCEFIEFGKNVKVGQGSIIMSNIIVKDKLIIKKVTIQDNVVIGAHSVILPGTTIGANSIIDVTSMTAINQHVEGNAF